MLKKTSLFILFVLIGIVLLLSACGEGISNKDNSTEDDVQAAEENELEVIAPHQDINQEPVPLKIERDGKDVFIEMTTQITDIEIKPGYSYKAWTFNGEAPGPLIVVEEGDILHVTLKNLDPAIPHSIDLHAVHTNPEIGFADVEPNEDGTFTFPTSSPGVFMYHWETEPALSHHA